MSLPFLDIQGIQFIKDGEPIILRGFGLGNWLNIEHFMIGLPGTENQIRETIKKVYGKKKADLFWETYRTAYVQEYDFKLLKSLGVNTVRIPFNHRIFCRDGESSGIREEGFFHLDRALELCRKYDIYAILDLHTAPGGQNPDWHSDTRNGENMFWEFGSFRERTAELWEALANRYKDEPVIAGYDLLNEPVIYDRASNELQLYYEELTRRIRKYDPKHIIFLEGNFYGTDFSALSEPSDRLTAYSFHFYPGQFSDQKELEDCVFAPAYAGAILDRLKRPAWCGETGTNCNKPDRIKSEEMVRLTLDSFEKRKVSWTLWAWKDNRNMGSIHPKKNSAWPLLSKKIRKDWLFSGELKQSYIDLEKIYPGINQLAEPVKHRLRFRMLADRQYLLVNRMEEDLKKIPFEELIQAVRSFHAEECEQWEEITGHVRKICLT